MRIPKRPATAVKCTIAFVEPLTAIKTRKAFSTDFSVMISLGRRGLVIRSTAVLPLNSAATSRSECTAGIAALPGNDIPSVSAMQAIVLAVPMTAQVPAVVAKRPSITSISSRSTSPARYLPQNWRQSVQAPNRSPLWRPVIIGPVTSCTAGMLADAAPIN